jgi:hypothetical protein
MNDVILEAARSPAVLEAAQDCRNAISEDLDMQEWLYVIAVLLVEVSHYTANPSKKITPAQQMAYALSVVQTVAPALLDDGPYTK